MAISKNFQLRGKQKDSYLDCSQSFPLISIQSEDHLKAAQKIMDSLFAKGPLSEGEELYLDALSDLVATFEDEHHAVEPASDADMLGQLLDAKGITQADLHRATGISKSTISEVLSGKKTLSLQLIRKLAGYFEIDPALLLGNL